MPMMIEYPGIGVCGLSCRLCTTYHTEGESKCGGCKTELRMVVGCPFITCAVKRKEIEFCWECKESNTCDKWKNHREFGKQYDTFKCYQKLEDNIAFIQKNGVDKFERQQEIREKLLKMMLRDFNEGRSKRYYSIAATVMEIDELKKVLSEAREKSSDLDTKERSKVLHFLLDTIAKQKDYILKLRKYTRIPKNRKEEKIK